MRFVRTIKAERVFERLPEQYRQRYKVIAGRLLGRNNFLIYVRDRYDGTKRVLYTTTTPGDAWHFDDGLPNWPPVKNCPQ